MILFLNNLFLKENFWDLKINLFFSLFILNIKDNLIFIPKSNNIRF
jgi:hypothetical protein